MLGPAAAAAMDKFTVPRLEHPGFSSIPPPLLAELQGAESPR